MFGFPIFVLLIVLIIIVTILLIEFLWNKSVNHTKLMISNIIRSEKFLIIGAICILVTWYSEKVAIAESSDETNRLVQLRNDYRSDRIQLAIAVNQRFNLLLDTARHSEYYISAMSSTLITDILCTVNCYYFTRLMLKQDTVGWNTALLQLDDTLGAWMAKKNLNLLWLKWDQIH